MEVEGDAVFAAAILLVAAAAAASLVVDAGEHCGCGVVVWCCCNVVGCRESQWRVGMYWRLKGEERSQRYIDSCRVVL